MFVRRWTIVLLASFAALFAACGGASDETGWGAQGIARSQEGAPAVPIVANSPFGIGPNRLSIGLIDDGALLSDADVTLRVYQLAELPEDEPKVARLRAEHVATPRSIVVTSDHLHGDGTVHVHESPKSTVFVVNVDFDASGWWGVELDVVFDGERHEGIRASFWVGQKSSEPSVGDVVPRSAQRTMRDVANVSEIDSSDPPNPLFHELTIAEALETGKPVVVAFVTPAFCQTRFCGPVMEEVILPAWAEYGDAVEFIHIEPFDLEAARRGVLNPVPTVEEWGLLSEPFVFVLESDGTVAAKFEGIMEVEEIGDALDAVLAP